MGAEEKVKETVNSVEQKLRDEGVTEAYTALKDQFDQYAQSGNSAADIQNYWNGVNKQLEQSGALTTLSLEYARQNSSIQGRDHIGQPVITQDSLTVPHKLNNDVLATPSFANNPAEFKQFRFDAMFQNELARQFKEGQGLANDGYIFQTEIAARLNQENDRAAVRDLIATAPGQERSALFDVLDKEKERSEKGDGHISQDDLKAYIERAEAVRQQNNGALPERYDPANPDATKYNQRWLKQVQHLNEKFEDYDNNDWPFGGEYITQDSLAGPLGYKDAKEMTEQNRVAAAPEQPADQVKPLKDRGNDLATAIRTLPTEVSDAFTQDGMSRQELRDTLEKDKQTPNLTIQQRETLTQLDRDWDALKLGDKADLSFLNADASYREHQVEKIQTAQAALATLSGSDMSALVDDQGMVDRAKLDAYLANPGENADAKRVEALKHLQTNWNEIAHNDKNFSQEQLKAYANANGAADFQPYKASPEAEAPPPIDAALKEKLDAMGALKQTDKLGNGGTFYDLAKRAMAERAALTGEKPDHNAIMREVARIVIVNEIGPESVRQNLQKTLDDPNGRITGADLPKAMNSFRASQELRLYADGDHERYAKRALAQAGGQDTNNDGLVNEDDYQFTGG